MSLLDSVAVWMDLIGTGRMHHVVGCDDADSHLSDAAARISYRGTEPPPFAELVHWTDTWGFEDNRGPVTYRDHDVSKCGKPFVGRQIDNSAKLGTNGSVKSAAAMTQARAAATRLQTLSQVFVSALNVAQAAFYT